jgi:hypothetical protein
MIDECQESDGDTQYGVSLPLSWYFTENKEEVDWGDIYLMNTYKMAIKWMNGLTDIWVPYKFYQL